MKAKLPAFLLCLCSIILVVGLTGCTGNSTSSGDGDTAATASTSTEEQFLDETVFPKDKVVDVKITIDEDDFQDMMDNASAEEIKMASVDYNGEHFDNIGVRTKGNLSLRSVVSMDDSDRYSLKLSFDEYLNQTLGGISKINLNNNYSDASYMREFLTYELAESMGLPTPKYSFVNVYINDELWGFYLAIEQIGDAYLERNFDNSYGALYKGIMGTGSDLLWIDDSTDSYPGLEMKSEKSNDDILIDMLDELNNGTDYEKYINVEDALGYIALNVTATNTDSYLGSNKQNYYLYEDDGVFSILPWDYNMAFGGLGQSSLLIDEPTQGALAERPLIAKLLAVDEYKEQYHEIISKAINGYLSNDVFSARVQQLQELISPYVKADPSSFYTYEEYESAVPTLVSYNASTVDNIAQQLDGTIASSGDGSGSGNEMGGMGGMGGGGFGGGDRPAMGAQTDSSANAQGGQGQQAPAAGADTSANAQGGQGQQAPAAGADAGANAQGGQGQQAPGGGAYGQGGQGGMQGGPGGMGGGFGGGGMPGGMGGGGFGGPEGQGNQPQGSASEAITAGIAIAILLLACVFIAFYKRKRL